jgi:glyoxylase-like metal-dependent hydrolase (beta-lactamase superfamily II)
VTGLGFDLFSPTLQADLKAAGFDTAGLLVDAVPWSGYDPGLYRLQGIRPTRLTDEGDTVDLGNRHFTVLHLPGHSPGGIGLWDEACGTLFAGDTLYDGILLDTLPGADAAAYVASMRRLRDLPARIVHGGHKPSFGRERMLELIDQHLRDRAG